MKQDFVALQKSSLSPERQLKAWERFLASYADDNPYSSEDDSLREQAQAQQARLQQSLAAAATPASVPASRPSVVNSGNQPQTGQSFRDCTDPGCPEMVWIPKGNFMMGLNESDWEKPVHQVSINYELAVGKYPVTFEQWDACIAEGGCSQRPDDKGWGRGNRPVINVSWEEAQQYITWLKKKTGKSYRLMSESEWEYAARAGTSTRYYWGDDAGKNHANCKGCGSQWDNKQTSPVGSFAPNNWGLYDMVGNVWTWLADCWKSSYSDAPIDGSARGSGSCGATPLRGGAWDWELDYMRVATRFFRFPENRFENLGFRLARTKE